MTNQRAYLTHRQLAIGNQRHDITRQAKQTQKICNMTSRFTN